MDENREEEVAVSVRTMTKTQTDVAEPEADADRRTKRLPPYNVIILNDEEHTFEYVIELLVKVFAHSVDTAKELTWKIHSSGRAIVYTTHKELAELKREQVVSQGRDPRMSISKGPLGGYIEPAVG